ncbi:LysR substrate-binding domain-containing protein [Rhizobium sp. AG855]|uniref:LysR substrate-binding domain-containing protein n=1 Tax=Rhizobium sp. AG855 TaxID=2183898 RepID=UPI000E75865A|nr:LysR substrate-binding domain-containing protein [Rhizobium sp. AG855]RKE84023.1 LysR family glycine cleavage system transcriptional activator [Rhizobium sp. AG855]
MKLSKQLPLNALRVFEAVARLESFTRAGEELGMSQTAVSYQIKLLEAHVGEALFLRRPRRISLSEAGERLLPKVTEGFELLREALADLRNTADGTLIIHATATFASQWLARHLGHFQLRNPGIAVRLDTSQEVIDFSRTQADLAIRTGRGIWPGLRAHFVMRNHFTPMLSPKLADSIGGVREPLDLLKLRIIDPSDPWWRIWFTAAGYPDVALDSHQRTRLGAQSFEAAAAVAGHGIAILRPEFYPEEIASGRLIQPFELTCEDGSHYWLVYPEARRNAGKIRAFREFMRSALQSFESVPPGAGA